MDNQEKIAEVKKDLQAVTDLSVIAELDGGKQLLKGLTIDIISAVESIVAGRDSFTLQQFIATACDIKTRLDIVRSITRAKDNKTFLEKELKDALAE